MMEHDDPGSASPAALTATRRRFLTLTGAAAALAFSTRLPGAGAAAALDRPPAGYPPGEYELRFATGGRRAALHRTVVTVSAPPEQQCVPGARMTATATSAQAGYGPELAIDGDPATFWHSRFSPPEPLPQSITLDLGGVYDLTGLRYRPRGDGNPTGTVTAYTIAVSTDGQEFTPVATGVWPGDAATQVAAFRAPGVRAIRLEATAGAGGFAVAAELVPVGVPVDVPAVTATGLDAPDVMPGGVATEVAVTLRNWTPRPAEVTTTVAVPESWTSTPTRVTLPADEEVAVGVAVTPPGGLPPAGTAPEVTLTGGVTSAEVGTAGRPEDVTWVAPALAGTAFALDAGTESSPLLDGWTRLAPADTWQDGDVAGWVGTVPEARDRGASDALRRDFTLARGRAGTLRVAVPPGVHDLALLRGDATSTSGSTVVETDGTTVVAGGGNLARGVFAWERFSVDGGDGGRVIDLVISNDTGSYWRLGALVMAPRAP